MTDELDALRAALKASPPPEAEAKAAALRLALENYDRLQ
jgi:Ca-activated chloride channel homolog